MGLPEIERVINTVADSKAKRGYQEPTTKSKIKLMTGSGAGATVIEFERPQIIRSKRLNATVLTRDEVEAFARLEARSRELSQG